MKAFLINVLDRTVTEVDYDGNYTSIYTLLSTGLEHGEVSNFEMVSLADGDGIFVDGEGLINGIWDDKARGFAWRGYHQPLLGNGLILGSDDDGASAPAVITLEEVKAHVTFATLL